jgi:hypothetical protein
MAVSLLRSQSSKEYSSLITANFPSETAANGTTQIMTVVSEHIYGVLTSTSCNFANSNQNTTLNIVMPL